MATITFNIISGQAPFTAILTPLVGVPVILTGLSLGINYFTGIAQAENYTITVTDANGCVYVIEDIDVILLECSETGIFQKAVSSIVVNNVMFLGERNTAPLIVRWPDPDNLTLYSTMSVAGVGSATYGLESVTYCSFTGKLYFSAKDNLTNCLAIIEVDPATLIYTKHATTIAGTLFPIAADDTYIYGSSNTQFFKIRIADWTIVQTETFAGFADGGAIALNILRNEFYVSSTGFTSKLAIVSTNDVSSYNIVDISAYVSHPSDDLCYYGNNVYIAGEYNVVNYGGAVVDATTLTVTGIELLASNGLWNYCTKIYNDSSTEKIEVFDVSDSSIITTYEIEETGFIPNEILFVEERMFLTKWGVLGVAKLCEYMSIDINCTTTTTSTSTSTTSTSSTTTTSTTIEPTTTTTTTGCYVYYYRPCGIWQVENATDEYREFSYRECYEEEWFGAVSLAPHTIYSYEYCREYSTWDCELIFTLDGECDTTTTTSTTICPCENEELVISTGETYGIADTWGTYCGLSQEKYIAQTFSIPREGNITRVGILGWQAVGSPALTMKCMILNTHLYGGRPLGGCPLVTPDDFPFIAAYYSTNEIRFEGEAPGSPQWYYFCFDDVYLENAGPWAIAFYFTNLDNNNATNYIQFCTGSGYVDGHFAYKIGPTDSNAFGQPLILYDLSCRICFASTVTTTTTKCIGTFKLESQYGYGYTDIDVDNGSIPAFSYPISTSSELDMVSAYNTLTTFTVHLNDSGVFDSCLLLYIDRGLGFVIEDYKPILAGVVNTIDLITDLSISLCNSVKITITSSCPTTTTTTTEGRMEICDVFFVSNLDALNWVESYNPSTKTFTHRFNIDYFSVDVACSDTRIWIVEGTTLHEYIITYNPFTYTYNRDLSLFTAPGNGLALRESDDVTNSYTFIGNSAGNYLREYVFTNGSTIATSYNLFSLGATIAGDIYYNKCDDTYTISFTNGKIKTYTSGGTVLSTINTSNTVLFSIFEYGGDLYLGDGNGNIWKVVDGALVLYDTTYHYLSGATQALSCQDCTTTTTTTCIDCTTTSTTTINQCTELVFPPVTINGITITSTHTGDVRPYTLGNWRICNPEIYMPENSVILGLYSSFSYTIHFSVGVNNLVLVLVGTNVNENFIITTNSGIPIISTIQSCFTTIIGNEIISGAGATNYWYISPTNKGGGGGGAFIITAPSSFTSMNISGGGGYGGTLVGICSTYD